MKTTHPDAVIIRWLGQQEYMHCLNAMQQFTNQRSETTTDEIWLLEHYPVFTQGQNGKAEHILKHSNIPVIQTDRGGQVTYHGPGQLMVYTLVDLKRKKLNVREFVTALEQTIVDFLAQHEIDGYSKCKAPGVYVDEKKICSIGLRVRRGCTYHGVAFNIAMNLEPFTYINPCGYKDLKMTQLSELSKMKDTLKTGHDLINYLTKNLVYDAHEFQDM